MSSLAASNGPEHWLMLVIFFAIFAACGLARGPRSRLSPSASILLGLLMVFANSLVLLIANRIGYDTFNLRALLTLHQATIESSFIILGYCLIVRGVAGACRGGRRSPVLRSSRDFV